MSTKKKANQASKHPRGYSQAALDAGYRSGLELSIQNQLKFAGITAKYEELTLTYLQPAVERKYTPDFCLPNGVIIEGKGRFEVDDRKKHLLIKEQYPELDIRFLFSNSKQTLNKRSKTTYAQWCEKHGFLYADRIVPLSWLKEPRKENLQRNEKK